MIRQVRWLTHRSCIVIYYAVLRKQADLTMKVFVSGLNELCNASGSLVDQQLTSKGGLFIAQQSQDCDV
jgi:hypothetical protein